MTQTPVVAMLKFGKHFTLETYACGKGIGAVLMQESRPISFLSKAIRIRNWALSVYEKEYLALLMAVTRWRHYLEHLPFIIKTDHQSLKFLLEQSLSTPLQIKGMDKLLGLKYTLRYRKGHENKAAGTLI